MKKKKNISKIDILSLYMDFVIEHKTKPLDVDDFCQNTELKEDNFYKHFKNLNKVEKTIFKEFFNNSLEVLNESEEFLTFDKKNKLLSFYYTFFENLNLNKEFVFIILKGCKNQLKNYKTLSSLKKNFTSFISTLDLTESIIPVDGLVKIQKKVINESAWLQLLFTIKFWLEDNSEASEKTDVLIEKSINTSFELLENKFLSNAFDLSKFIYQEKFQKKK